MQERSSSMVVHLCFISVLLSRLSALERDCNNVFFFFTIRRRFNDVPLTAKVYFFYLYYGSLGLEGQHTQRTLLMSITSISTRKLPDIFI